MSAFVSESVTLSSTQHYNRIMVQIDRVISRPINKPTSGTITLTETATVRDFVDFVSPTGGYSHVLFKKASP